MRSAQLHSAAVADSVDARLVLVAHRRFVEADDRKRVRERCHLAPQRPETLRPRRLVDVVEAACRGRARAVADARPAAHRGALVCALSRRLADIRPGPRRPSSTSHLLRNSATFFRPFASHDALCALAISTALQNRPACGGGRVVVADARRDTHTPLPTPSSRALERNHAGACLRPIQATARRRGRRSHEPRA